MLIQFKQAGPERAGYTQDCLTPRADFAPRTLGRNLSLYLASRVVANWWLYRDPEIAYHRVRRDKKFVLRGARMGVPGAARTIALAFAGMAVLCLVAAARETPRLVPQLELTDLEPQKLAFAPDDATLLMVVNESGRIDLFDIGNPGRPVKITEIGAAARAAAFAPKGTARDRSKLSPAARTARSGCGRSTASLRRSRSRDTTAGSRA